MPISWALALLPKSPGGWVKLVALAGSVILVVSVLWSAWSWFDTNEKTLTANASTIERQETTIAQQKDALARAQILFEATKAAFTKQVDSLKADIVVLTDARKAAERRARSFDTLRKELTNVPSDGRRSSDVLIHAVDGVRARLRGKTTDLVAT